MTSAANASGEAKGSTRGRRTYWAGLEVCGHRCGRSGSSRTPSTGDGRPSPEPDLVRPSTPGTARCGPALPAMAVDRLSRSTGSTGEIGAAGLQRPPAVAGEERHAASCASSSSGSRARSTPGVVRNGSNTDIGNLPCAEWENQPTAPRLRRSRRSMTPGLPSGSRRYRLPGLRTWSGSRRVMW